MEIPTHDLEDLPMAELNVVGVDEVGIVLVLGHLDVVLELRVVDLPGRRVHLGFSQIVIVVVIAL